MGERAVEGGKQGCPVSGGVLRGGEGEGRETNKGGAQGDRDRQRGGVIQT